MSSHRTAPLVWVALPDASQQVVATPSCGPYDAPSNDGFDCSDWVCLGLGVALAAVSGRSAAPGRSISGRQGASSTRMPVAIAKNLADGAAPRAAAGRGSGR